jgi:cytochrome c oxidase subunit II
MNSWLPLWPASASAYADRVDLLVWAFSALNIALAAPVILGLLWFVAKYRRGSPADRSHPPTRGLWIEADWTVIPFLLAMIFFVWAAHLYYADAHPPDSAMEIAVVAKQWMWKAQHPGGQREINELHVPTGRPVKLTMTSQDVIHSLFLPELRLKQDVLPDRYTYLWFEADRPGAYALRCTQFCGTDHAVMGGRLIVQEPKDYEAWLASSAVAGSLAQEGEMLFRHLGCSGCHGANSAVHAPDLTGIYGTQQPLSDGGFARADDRYIRDSILMPKFQVVAGYEPIMPSFAGKIAEEEILRLIAYIKSLPREGNKRP